MKGYLDTSTIPRVVPANGSSRVSETLAKQGLLAHQWLMGEMAPRREIAGSFDFNQLAEGWTLRRSTQFQGIPSACVQLA